MATTEVTSSEPLGVTPLYDEPPPSAQKRVRKGSEPVISLPGDSVEETVGQRALLVTHFSLVSACLCAAFAGSGGLAAASPAVILAVMTTVAASVIVGDFATGVFHWATDNYGTIDTPIVGAVCAAFQGHHETPWTITFRSFANNVYKICYNTIPVLALTFAASVSGVAGPLWTAFFALFCNWWVLSQEFHKYSHMRQVPPVVAFLQSMGLILTRKEHGLHHSSPFEGHYCILTGICNPVLDNSGFWRVLERAVYRLTGNKPNTWKAQPSLSGGIDA